MVIFLLIGALLKLRKFLRAALDVLELIIKVINVHM